MKWIVSRYNHDISYLPRYTDDVVLYDRSEKPLGGAIKMPNIGSDLFDKFTFIIDNYQNLPEVAVYTKANLFKYITPEEFDLIKDNKTFTPILTRNHKEKTMNMWEIRDQIITMIEKVDLEQEYKDLWYQFNQLKQDDFGPMIKKFAFYDDDGMYNELNINYYFKLYMGREKEDIIRVKEIQDLLGIFGKEYNKFAPGSNYILPKENILKHPLQTYIKLRNYLVDAIYLKNEYYPREAYLIERGLYNLWN